MQKLDKQHERSKLMRSKTGKIRIRADPKSKMIFIIIYKKES